MREQRLLERICTLTGEEAQPQDAGGKETKVNSIIAYLWRIFNTRVGSVPIAEDFGVPSYASLASRLSTATGETLEEIKSAIINSIRKYEPRLKNPRARILDKGEFDIDLVVEIQGQVVTDEGTSSVTIKTTMKPDGRIDVTL